MGGADAEFRTVKGVAGRTVARLMAELPEIGTLSNKAVAKLAGLAPIANDSGKRSGKRPIRGGREGVRSILFVAPTCAGLTRTLPTSTPVSTPPESQKKSSGSHSPTSCSRASTPRHETCETHSPPIHAIEAA